MEDPDSLPNLECRQPGPSTKDHPSRQSVAKEKAAVMSPVRPPSSRRAKCAKCGVRGHISVMCRSLIL